MKRLTKKEIAIIVAVQTCPHEKYSEVSVWPLWCSKCHVFKQFIKGYHAGRAEMSAEFEHLREQVSALLREGMDATGTSTLHYQKMAEAKVIELMGSDDLHDELESVMWSKGTRWEFPFAPAIYRAEACLRAMDLWRE